ncbi:MAG: HEAT repeat domain-containing protein [Gemmataceae bacterium]|nr:HEAT repeat domain-containing protein [Gemmataceae bacterium]
MKAVHHTHSLRTAHVLLLLAAGLLVAPHAHVQDAKDSWAKKFPAIAVRIKHLDERMNSPEEYVRKRVLNELTSYQPRDSKHYPPFLRALLKDSSPALRWQAVHQLWEHNHFVDKKDLPAILDVPLMGEFAWQDPKHLERFRSAARSPDADGGWAIHALGIVGDKESIPLAKNLLSSKNVFTRFSAAMLLVQLGEVKEGVDALYKITDSNDEPTGFYRCRAAEVLVRLGHKKAIESLFQEVARGTLSNSTYSPLKFLEDLTGQYFSTAAEWRRWWQLEQRNGK